MLPELPEWGPVENYKQEIEKLPLTCGPGVFGLHSNAEIAYYTLFTESMWKNLISLQPREARSNEGVSREDLIATTAREIEGKVPIISIDIGSFDLLVTRKLLLEQNRSSNVTPCQVVLLQGKVYILNGVIKIIQIVSAMV